MKPQLAQLYEPRRLTGPFVVQPKLNGIRALYQNGRMYSRDEIPWQENVLEHITRELKHIIPSDWILDGELYMHGWSLQRINSAVAVKRNFPTNETASVIYNVFDTVSSKDFITRFAELCILLRCVKATRLVPTHPCSTVLDGDTWFAHYIRESYEGIIYRIINRPYEPSKRVNHMLKRKGWQDDEFTITGVEEGEGRCAGMLGALELICDGGAFKVGTGYDDKTRQEYLLNPPIGQRATIQYLMLSDAGIPLNTSFKGLYHETH